MKESLSIVVDMKISGGYIEYCRFLMVDDQTAAEQTFEQLRGIQAENSDLPLRISLVRLIDGPYEVLAVKYCRLDELAWNSRLITRDIFKYHNLEK